MSEEIMRRFDSMLSHADVVSRLPDSIRAEFECQHQWRAVQEFELVTMASAVPRVMRYVVCTECGKERTLSESETT